MCNVNLYSQRVVRTVITLSTGYGILGSSQFVHLKDFARTLVIRRVLARANCVL